MLLKRPLFILAVILLLVEFTALFMMPEQPMIENIESQTEEVNLEYVQYYVVAFSAAFIAFFTLLIGSILFILRGNFYRHLITVILLAAGFLVPVIWYYT